VKDVPFFQTMTIDQLRALASVCEEQRLAEASMSSSGARRAAPLLRGRRSGRDRARDTRGRARRLAIIDARSYFGESDLFDNRPRSTAAVALEDTLVLRLRPSR